MRTINQRKRTSRKLPRALAIETLESRWVCTLGLIHAPPDLSAVPAVESQAVSPAPPLARTTMVNNGPSANRVDMVFLGDGYTSSQVSTQYVADINAGLDHFFHQGEDPFPRYEKFFNVHRIDVISNQSGADVPPEGIFRDTALDAKYYFDGVTDRLLYVSESKANAALNSGLTGAGFKAELKLVTVNDSRHGGGGGSYAVYAGGNAFSPESALHEMGHTFSGLADEYDYSDGATYTGGEPAELNVTKSSSGQKWAKWIGYTDPDHPELGAVGAFEGARYNTFGVYRPTVTSKMRELDTPFNAISREKIIRDIYALVDPLDGWLDNAGVIEDENPQLSVDVIDPAVIKVEWRVNGVVVPGATGQTFRPTDFGIAPNQYTITARAFDPTDWVRGDRSDLEESVTWSVIIDQAAGNGPNVSTQVIADGRRATDQRLVIRGSGDAEQITVSLGADGDRYKVRLMASGGTTINGGPGPVEFTGINLGVTVTLLGGNDLLTLSGRMKRSVSVDGGSGDDHYVFASTKTKYVLNDSGGIDLFDFSQLSKGSKINLGKATGRKQGSGAGNSVALTGQIENLFGSPFKDKLTGNAADNIITGGGGKDSLRGGTGGFDILIGGDGKDKLTSASGGNNLLIAGSTDFDTNEQALLAILNEWRRQSGGTVLPIDTRVDHLTGATPGGLNGGTLLTSPGTVTDDGLVDKFKILGGNNWFLKAAGDKLKGKLSSDRPV